MTDKPKQSWKLFGEPSQAFRFSTETGLPAGHEFQIYLVSEAQYKRAQDLDNALAGIPNPAEVPGALRQAERVIELIDFQADLRDASPELIAAVTVLRACLASLDADLETVATEVAMEVAAEEAGIPNPGEWVAAVRELARRARNHRALLERVLADDDLTDEKLREASEGLLPHIHDQLLEALAALDRAAGGDGGG